MIRRMGWRWRRRYILGGRARQMEEEAYSWMNSMPKIKFPFCLASSLARGEMTRRNSVKTDQSPQNNSGFFNVRSKNFIHVKILEKV